MPGKISRALSASISASIVLPLAFAAAPAPDETGRVVATVARLHEAGLRRDAAAMEKLYAPDYFHTNPDGSVMKLADVLASYRTDPKTTISSQQTSEQTVLLRDAFAVVTEKIALHGRTAEGDRFLSRFRVTYILERGGSRSEWRVVNSHSSFLGTARNPEPRG
ncbi:MAG: nuclear transport factor 2 family protein [Acidobacteriota bacterium]